jgi:hypothetical protein
VDLTFGDARGADDPCGFWLGEFPPGDDFLQMPAHRDDAAPEWFLGAGQSSDWFVP